MESNWAAEHLQVIRTLMERSALYRRALAPIMLISGAIGVTGAAAARMAVGDSAAEFTLYWLGVGVVAFGAALLMVRRQALKAAEPFWSPPTRRVAGGLFPCFLSGLAVALTAVLNPGLMPAWLVACVWILNYGCALRAAGFFMERGIKLFGGAFLFGGVLLLAGSSSCPWLRGPATGHILMGAFFGGLHLAYGGYLYFTERNSST